MSKQIDETAGRLGAALRHARHIYSEPLDESARLLRIFPNDLAQYECGHAKIPFDVLQRLVIMGYMMIRLRDVERRCRYHRAIFRKQDAAAPK